MEYTYHILEDYGGQRHYIVFVPLPAIIFWVDVEDQKWGQRTIRSLKH